MASYTAPRSLMNDMPRGADEDEDSSGMPRSKKIIDREDDYRRRRLNRIISPERHDAFAAGEKTPDPSVRTYAEIMREEALKREKEETLRLIAKKKKKAEESGKAEVAPADKAAQKRRNRWDQSQDGDGGAEVAAKKAKTTTSDWDLPDWNSAVEV